MNFLSIIDHTALKPDTTATAIATLCNEAMDYGFASVCVNPCYVSLAAELLADSAVKICTVIGFPLGSNTSEVKAFETKDAISKGADEIDMVINNNMVKNLDWDGVASDIKAVVKAANGKLVKVIIETSLLCDEEKIKVCQIAKDCGANFVKTSTGFIGGGATPEDIKLMRETVGPIIGVKASGGVRDIKSAAAMVENGATRLGTSSGIAIANGQIAKSDY